MKILQIVGYKNSGKTTLINELIKEIRSQQLTVTTIKHHGHGADEISLNHKEVDSLKFINSGAKESIVLGKQLIERVTFEEKSLQQIIDEDLSNEPDVLLIEGFKHDHFPKVLLTKQSEDLEQTLQNIVYQFDAFNLEEKKDFIVWFENWLKK
ncbi:MULTISPECIES: molybdopterin-guanine dinucleotide biosynthesis protein B [unclassified Mammaliicoccus]|uniref:molybdopterin-guanine dinucleotide biosynthesis protein B n=1 Tax=unclassified Mammaliicoccus TaxID=2803851 RepID=UPI001EFBBDE1|nr:MULTISPECIES: molybdopterin-guanine dinucleotide biosynthesis protein B [unclassified Mammaliicoccus]